MNATTDVTRQQTAVEQGVKPEAPAVMPAVDI
jgi:hypothetical protein